MWFFYLYVFINMKLVNLLNEIINEAIGDFNRGGLRGSGVGAGRVGMNIDNLKNKLGGVSTTKGLGGIYKSSKQAQQALANLDMRRVTIGNGKNSEDAIISFSTDSSITNIQYLYITQQVFTTITNICRITNNEFKANPNNRSLFQIKTEKTNKKLLYDLKENNVMYYGMNNTTGKFYVPKTYTTAPTTILMQEDISFLTNNNYNPANYKVYKFPLTVKP